MQNDEYYDLFLHEWNKMLGEQPNVTEQEKAELHELMEKQKSQKGIEQNDE